MKFLTRILLACTAISMLLVPVANAQPRHDHRPGHHYSQSKKPQFHKKAPARHHWKKGHRYSNWKRAPAVRDYHRHGLRKPARGQQWIKADNSYLLVSLATGLIVGIAAAR